MMSKRLVITTIVLVANAVLLFLLLAYDQTFDVIFNVLILVDAVVCFVAWVVQLLRGEEVD